MKRGTGWPIAMGVILGISVVGNFWMAHVASSDPSVAIEPNYYDRAIHWDEHMAQVRANEALGWTVAPSLSPIVSGSGSRLQVALHDRDGRPLDGARIDVIAVNNLIASEPLSATLIGSGEGIYFVMLPLRRTGLWELRFDVHRGTDHFTADVRLDAFVARGS